MTSFVGLVFVSWFKLAVLVDVDAAILRSVYRVALAAASYCFAGNSAGGVVCMEAQVILGVRLLVHLEFE